MLPRSSSLDLALETGEAQPLACDPQAPAMMPVFQLRDEALGWGRRQAVPLLQPLHRAGVRRVSNP